MLLNLSVAMVNSYAGTRDSNMYHSSIIILINAYHSTPQLVL